MIYKGLRPDRALCLVDKSCLNEHQRYAHDMIVAACLLPKGTSNVDDGDGICRLQILVGAGGCGKSFLIDSVLTTLTTRHGWNPSNYALYATTGKAATSINGSTLQNYTDGLCFFFNRPYKPLSSRTLEKMQLRMKDLRLVIIDEFSMLSQADLHIIDQRLKEGLMSDAPFGGAVVVLCGDPAQLPAVKANSVWFNKPKHGTNAYQGYFKYKLFGAVVELVENNRLDRDDPDYDFFSSFLTHLRTGQNTFEEWERLCKQCSQHSIDPVRWANKFDTVDATYIFTTNKEVAQQNILCLQASDSPIVLIQADNTGDGQRASANSAGGLQSQLYLRVGAKVLLTRNLWQSVELCNGASGVVRDIYYESDRPPPALPQCVLVDCGEVYAGPSFFPSFLP